jgi:hypothetical protein
MATNQSKILIAAVLAAMLVWLPSASAGGHNGPPAFMSGHTDKNYAPPKTICENLKLDATSHYFQCLMDAYRVANTRGSEPSDFSMAKCDNHFYRVVERAEAVGGCHTPGNPSVLGDPIKALAKASALGITAELGGCTALTINNQFATCTLGPGGRAVDLPAVIDAINAVGGNVNADTIFYIEAWGGDGGPGNTNNGSRGGYGGYAQTTTTLSAISATFGTTELYYFLGVNGIGGANAGGDGGTATMITTNDLATEQATIADTLVIAGGAGGGGAGRGKAVCACASLFGCTYVYGPLGGNGGAAIAALDVEALNEGTKGGEREGYNYSGSGGEGNTTGTGGTVNGADHVLSQPAADGGNVIAPIGGIGGNHSDPKTGFANSTTVISNAGGQGGNGQDDAGGGGGGGGWGGGAGGAGNVDPDNSGDNTQCFTGGGGGGASLAVASTATCSAAPTSAPANPNGSQGYARIVFDLGGCQ